MTPSDVVAAIGRARASAILRTHEADVVLPAVEAAIAGGLTVVEVTLTTPGAYEAIAALAERPGLVVGAGTVLEVAQAERAVRAGARYLVSPVVDEAVIAAARELGAVAMPGCHTPTELLRAHRAGAELLKLFPAPAGGPAWLRSVLGPLPDLRIVPTNGTSLDTAPAWLQAGAFAVGFVGDLFRPGWLSARDWPALTAHARALVEACRAAR